MLKLFATFAGSHPALLASGIFFILLLCGFGLPLPEDIILAFTGYIVHRGVLPLWFALAIGLGGVIIGDSTLWWIGHRYGENVLSWRWMQRILSPARLAKIQKLYEKYGSRILIMARFTPVLRSSVFLFAGWAGISYKKFLLTDGSAAVLSVPAIIVCTYIFGNQIDKAIKAIRGTEHWILIAIGLIVLLHVVRGHMAKRREIKEQGSEH